VPITPAAGRIFETKNRAVFLERFFGRGISGEALLVYNFVPINWLWSGFMYPRIRTFVEKRFHDLFSKKKHSKSGGVPPFSRREHVLAENSLPSGQRSLSIHFTRLLDYLKSSDIFCPRKLFWAKIPLPKNLSRKIARFFVSKIRPATGVSNNNILILLAVWRQKKTKKGGENFLPSDKIQFAHQKEWGTASTPEM